MVHGAVLRHIQVLVCFIKQLDVVKAKVDEAQWAESVVAEEWPKHTWHHQKPGFTFRGVC